MIQVFNNKIEGVIDVVQIRDVVEEGVTIPVRCRLSNGIDAIVKYQKNQVGTFVLVNEWIGNQIADIIGLSIPRYGICNISKEVINQTNDNPEIGEDNSGLAFFSEYLTDAVPVNTSFLEKMNNRETERLILFDVLVSDFDRHNGNVLCSFSRKKLFFIDCSHLFTSEGYFLNRSIDMEKELSADRLMDIHILRDARDNVYDRLCSGIGYREDVLFEECERIKSFLTEDVIDSVFESIPAAWQMSVFSKQRIDNIRTIIGKKLTMIDSITSVIADERRNREWKKY